MFNGKISIRPTDHYKLEHSDVDWNLVIKTILSPTKTHPNKRYGKDRFTYVKVFQDFYVEIHTKNDYVNNIIWVINAFKGGR